MNYIYALVDPRTNGVRYIGVTAWAPERRLRNHIHRARRGEDNHRFRWIRSLLKEGLKPTIIVLEETEDRSRESYWIQRYLADGVDLTNSTEGGGGLVNPTEEVREKIRKSVTGFRHSDEAKAKIAEASRLRWQDPEHRAKFSATMVGHEISEETRKKISVANQGLKTRLGHKNTAEHNAKISASNKGIPRPGKPHTPEAKAKIAAAKKGNTWNRGRVHTDEARANMAECKLGNQYGKGRIVSEETRAAMSVSAKEWIAKNGHSQLGTQKSEESKRKQSEGMKAAWAKKREQ